MLNELKPTNAAPCLVCSLPDNQDEVKEKTGRLSRCKDGDDVVISQILPYNEQAVYLEGHVFRPGKYPYRDGMTINDLCTRTRT